MCDGGGGGGVDWVWVAGGGFDEGRLNKKVRKITNAKFRWSLTEVLWIETVPPRRSEVLRKLEGSS